MLTKNKKNKNKFCTFCTFADKSKYFRSISGSNKNSKE